MNALRTKQLTTGCAHSNGKPGVPASTTNISVRFAPNCIIRFRIERVEKPMKPSMPNPAVGLVFAPDDRAPVVGYQPQIMKQSVASLIAIAAAVMMLAGCQRQPAGESTPPANPPDVPPAPSATNSVGPTNLSQAGAPAVSGASHTNNQPPSAGQ